MSRTTKVILCDSLYNDDCGVLAIAFALWCMCMDCSPPPTFEQDKVWSHLDCMETNHIIIFPTFQ